MMDIQNPRFTRDNRIDCEIKHPDLGWIPFTASADDIEPFGREIYATARALGPATFVPPPAPSQDDLRAAARADMRLSFSQLLIGLVTEGWISEAEGEGWLSGQLPAAVIALIATLPSAERFAAKARALRPDEIARTDPLVSALASAEGKTGEEVDAFFRIYAAI